MRWIAAFLLTVGLLGSGGCTAYDALFGVYDKGYSSEGSSFERQQAMQAEVDRWRSSEAETDLR